MGSSIHFLGSAAKKSTAGRRKVRRYYRPRPEQLEDRRLLAVGTFFEDFTEDSDRILNPPPNWQFTPAWDTSDNDPLTMPGGDADNDPLTSLGPDELLIRNDFPFPTVTNGPTQTGGYAVIVANPFAPSGPNILALTSVEGQIATIIFDFPNPGDPGSFALDEEVATASLDLRGIGEVEFVGAGISLVMPVDTRDPASGQRLWQHISVGRESIVQQGVVVFHLGAIQRIIVRTSRALDINRIGVLVFPKPTPQTKVVANDDYAIVSQRTQNPSVTFNWRQNDVDEHNDPLTVVSHTMPAHGSVTMNEASGTATYTPDPGYLGRDSFEYTLTDGQGNIDRANVIIDVTDNVPPVSRDYTGDDIKQLGPRQTQPIGFVLGYDDDGDPMTVRLEQEPHNGFLTFESEPPDATGRSRMIAVYTPFSEFGPYEGGFVHNDRFLFRLSDGAGVSDLGTVEILTVEAVVHANNDVFRSKTRPDMDSTRPGYTIFDAPGVLANDRALLGEIALPVPIYATLGRTTLHGILSLNKDGSFEYYADERTFPGGKFPEAGFVDRFSYYAHDGLRESEEAFVQIVVSGDDTEELFAARSDHLVIEYRPEGGLFDVHELGRQMRLNDLIPAEYQDEVEDFEVGFHFTREPWHGADDRGIHPGFTGNVVFYYSLVRVNGSHIAEETNNATLFLTVVDQVDADGDGIRDVDEDRNGGGSNSAEKAAIRNNVDDRVVTLDSTEPLRNVRANPAPPGAPADMPIGVFAFEIHAGQAEVTITPPAGLEINTYYKLGTEPIDSPLTTNINESTTPHWYPFLWDGVTGAKFKTDDDTDPDTDKIILHFVDGQRGDHDPTPGVIRDPGGPAFAELLPHVQSVTINDGSAQRSKVSSLTVAFDSFVTIASGGLELYRQGLKRPLPLRLAILESDGRTVARLTFKGHHIGGGSLGDGQYRLVVRGDKVRDASGRRLDGDDDGSEGGNYVDEFFRRFGDTDGDGDVDKADQSVFKSAYGKRSNRPGYLWYLDHNANGRIGAEDLGYFLLNFGPSTTAVNRGPEARHYPPGIDLAARLLPARYDAVCMREISWSKSGEWQSMRRRDGPAVALIGLIPCFCLLPGEDVAAGCVGINGTGLFRRCEGTEGTCPRNLNWIASPR